MAKTNIVRTILKCSMVGFLFSCGLFSTSAVMAESKKLTITNEPVLAISVPSEVYINPTLSENFKTEDLTVNVSTNSRTGYVLNLAVPNTDMVSQESNVIPTLSSSTTVANFPDNKWGISLDGGNNFIGASASESQIHTTSAPAGTSEKLIKLGVKVTAAQASGRYSTTLNFTAVANFVDTDITLTFDANGGTFPGGSTTNVLSYSVPEITHYPGAIATTSTTDSADASGVHKTSIDDPLQYYDGGAFYYQDLTLDTDLPGPYDLTIYYSLVNGQAGFCVLDGDTVTPEGYSACFDPPAIKPQTNDGGRIVNETFIVGTDRDGETSYAHTATFKVQSKIARVIFQSFVGSSYGFWAEYKIGGDVITQNLLSGTYAEPSYTGGLFLGWSTSPTATTPDWAYKTDKKIMENTTIYAVWGKNSTITYNCNGGAGTISPQTKIYGTNLTLNNGSACSRSGYILLGWDTDPSSTSPTHKLSGNYSKETDANLYAVWAGSMQNFNCSTLASGVVKLLADSRDGSTYHVTKLADGKCWMLDNLALDLTNSTVKTNLSSSTTNASDKTLSYLKNGGGSSPYTAYAVARATPYNYYDRPAIDTLEKDYIYGAPVNGKGFNKVGVYYNFCAASAGSYCYSSSSSSGNATEDICPKGWRIPTGGASGEYQRLYTDYYKTYTDYRNALSLPLSGYFFDGFNAKQGSLGVFWSSTRDYNDRMYSLSVDTSGINPADFEHNVRRTCYSVRCVAGS